MDFIKWSDLTMTGLKEIDDQHFGLIEQVNALAPLLSSGEHRSQDTQDLLDHLSGYARDHFETEERLMLSSNLDSNYVSSHARAHHGFVEEVGRMRAQLDDEGMLDGRQILSFLAGWLTFHILVEDQRMARQIRLVREGHNPKEATTLEHESLDFPAQAVLTRAMIDLFAVVNQRNRALESVNAQLKQTETELKDLNASLEAQVESRTRELEQFNVNLQQQRDSLLAAADTLSKTQSQLLQSEKMAAVGQLAAGVAHEINNPIGFVSSNLHTLKKYAEQLIAVADADAGAVQALEAAHPVRRAIEGAHDKAELDYLRQDLADLLSESSDGLARVKKIVADLKDFSHVDEAEWQDVDINQGLESTLNVAWNELKYKATVVRDFGQIPVVHCIAAQMNQVFLNLLINASHAIEAQGTITVRTRQDGEHVLIEIEDTGKGIAPEIRGRIFEPFFTTKPIGKGTGLGLSISWEIIQRHHGSISVESEVGRGTTFRISLPVSAADASAPHPA